ncbi:MAG: hypothetical protein KAX19_02740, partial [Candidatus Brocadiae bacterium]|nr:hypothetical protein [Candidatus Brocadiia bacterium]
MVKGLCRWALRVMIWCVALLALVSVQRSVSADKIILKDGRELSGRLERVGDRMWVLLDSGGRQFVRKESIDRVEKEVVEVTLRDGRTGRLLGKAGDEVVVSFRPGNVERVPQEQVERTTKKVVVETFEEKAGESAEKPQKVKLPSLQTTLGRLLEEVLPSSLPPGLIAKITQHEVFV